MKPSTLMRELRGKLVQYLLQHDIDIRSKNIECIYKERHKDGTDDHHSMGLLPGRDATHCFTCGAVADIFAWANKLDKLPPINSPDFYTITLPALANKLLGINYIPKELSEEHKEQVMIKQMYNIAADYIASNSNVVRDYILERGWEKAALKYSIGSVPSFNDFIAFMSRFGYTIDVLEKAKLYDEELFNENRLIIPVFSAKGNVISFVGRAINDKIQPRYKNTKSIDVFEKYVRLYGLENIKNTDFVYIVEGPGDVLTMYEYGYTNTVGLLGCNISLDQINVLYGLGIKYFYVLLDGDMAWLPHFESQILTIIRELPVSFEVGLLDKYDPDEHLKINKSLNGVPFVSFLNFVASRDKQNNNNKIPQHRIDRYTDIIAISTSQIAREKMINELANMIDIDISVLRREVIEKRSLFETLEYKEEELLRKELFNLLKSPDYSVSDIIYKIETKIKDKRKKNIIDPLQMASIIANEAYTVSQKARMEPAIKLGSFKRLETDTDGLSRNANLMLISGVPHVGKSSFVRHLITEIALNNSDITCIYFSMEDSKEKAIPSIISIINKYPSNLNRNLRRMESVCGSNGVNAYYSGWNKYLDLVNEKRLLVYDRTIGTTLESIDEIISMVRDTTDSSLFVAIDSLNSLTEKGVIMAMNEALVHRTSKLKDMIEKYNIPILTVAELRKTHGTSAQQLSMEDISYTYTLPYRADVIFLLGMEFQTSNDAPTGIYLTPESGQVAYPIVSMNLKKNKINGYTGIYDFVFVKDRSLFVEMEATYGKKPTF